jgi:hypothetical protein
MQDLLNVENLVELHEKLNEFATHHQNKGGQKAHQLIKAMWDDSKSTPRSGKKNDLIHDEGFDLAFKAILDMLHIKFVP